MTWKFDGEDSDLLGFLVEVDGEEVTEVYPTVVIQGLRPAAINLIAVVALYKDGRRTKCQHSYRPEGNIFDFSKGPNPLILHNTCMKSVPLIVSYIFFMLILTSLLSKHGSLPYIVVIQLNEWGCRMGCTMRKIMETRKSP